MFTQIALTGIVVCIVCVFCIRVDGRAAELVPSWKVILLAGGYMFGLICGAVGAIGSILTM